MRESHAPDRAGKRMNRSPNQHQRTLGLRRLARRFASGGDDRGDVTIWMLFWIPVLILGFGTVLDYGGAIRARSFTSDAALGASRAGAVEVVSITGEGPRLREAEALAAARAYIAAIDVPDNMTLSATYATAPDAMVVTVTTVYDPLLLEGMNKSFSRTEVATVEVGQ